MNKNKSKHHQKRQDQSFRSVYIRSLGNENSKQISCCINLDKKLLKFEKSSQPLSKLLNTKYLKMLLDTFNRIKRIFQPKINKIQTVFLPQALLNNDQDILKQYGQALRKSSIDRYISLYFPSGKTRSSSNKKTLQPASQYKFQKQIDSTYFQNRQQSAYSFKSIKTSRKSITSKNMSMFSVNNNNSQINSTTKKSGVINITYKKIRLNQQNKDLKSSKINFKSHHSNYQTKPFSLDQSQCDNYNKYLEQNINKTSSRIKQQAYSLNQNTLLKRKVNHYFQTQFKEIKQS